MILWIRELGKQSIAAKLPPEMVIEREENRVKQIAVGVGILLLLTLLVCGSLLGWGYLPGLLGEWIGTMIGVMTTPFFLEGSFIVIGLMIVVTLNHWRQKRDGDEMVYLEQVDGPDVPAGLPDQAKWAVFRDKPLSGVEPSLLEQAEGALAIGEHATAAECLGAMSEEDLKRPETLVVRLELAKSTGLESLAEELRKELAERSHEAEGLNTT